MPNLLEKFKLTNYKLYDRDTILENVPEYAQVVAKNASLTVLGDVGEGAKVVMSCDSQVNNVYSGNDCVSMSIIRTSESSSIGSVSVNNISFVNGNELIAQGAAHDGSSGRHKLIVQGIVRDGSMIGSDRADLELNRLLKSVKVENNTGKTTIKSVESNSSVESNTGKVTITTVGPNSSVKNNTGETTITNLGPKSSVESNTGKVTITTVGPKSSVENNTGETTITNLGPNASATSNTGDIYVTNADPSATINSRRGKTYINGELIQDNSSSSNFSSLGHVTVSGSRTSVTFFSGFSGENATISGITICGKEVTYTSGP
jgi:hypothetical protein